MVIIIDNGEKKRLKASNITIVINFHISSVYDLTQRRKNAPYDGLRIFSR